MSKLEPSLIRTHRRCSTKNCSHAALFFPWIKVFVKNGHKLPPLEIESPRQYCPRCMDKIKTPDDMGKDWRMVLDNAQKVFKTEYDADTARIDWLPLIIGNPVETNQPATHSQRLHD